MAFSPDGQRLVCGSGDGTVKVWDFVTDKEAPSLMGHQHGTLSLAFSPNGRRLAGGGGTWLGPDDVKIWDMPSGKEIRLLKGHGAGVAGVCFSSDSRRLASASFDGTVKIWDTETGQEIRTFYGHSGYVLSVAFSPDDKQLVSGSDGGFDFRQSMPGEVKVWDVSSGQNLLTLKGHTDAVYCVVFSADGRRMASASKEEVKLWYADTWPEIFALEGGYQWFGVIRSSDGQRLAGASHEGTGDGIVRIWDASTGQELHTLKGHINTNVGGVAFSPDSRRLASIGVLDGQIKVWNVETGQEIRTFEGNRDITDREVAFRLDG